MDFISDKKYLFSYEKRFISDEIDFVSGVKHIIISGF
jgi:hypothetical protein